MVPTQFHPFQPQFCLRRLLLQLLGHVLVLTLEPPQAKVQVAELAVAVVFEVLQRLLRHELNIHFVLTEHD